MRVTSNVLLISASLLVLGGCAGVRVLKVSTQPEPEGIPFYLPRPYVQVFEPFVIGSTAYLVSGVLSPDGKYLLIDNVKDKNEMSSLFKSDLGKDIATRIPISAVRNPRDAYTVSGAPQGATETTPVTTPTPAAPGEPKKVDEKDEPAKPSTTSTTDTPSSGKYGISVTNTTAIFTPTLGRRFFDIVWMPDFDEKYVVQGKPGLGNANIAVTMTQGWGLYGLDAKIDNSAVVKPLLDFYSTSFAALGKLATSKIMPLSAVSGAPQGALDTAAMTAGTRVSIKITKVTVAAPGLYPILKPKEVTGASDATPLAEGQRRFLPLRPYTNVAFNTYEVVVVEATKPSGDSPMNLQRYFDPATGEATGYAPPPSPYQTESANFDVQDFEKNANALLANRKSPTLEYWKLSGFKVDGVKLKGTTTLIGGANKPPELNTVEQLKIFLSTESQSRFQPKDIEITEAKK
ncbi:hypothetical protein [Massilia sp. TWR1-2-2]|uniref:hypothetical protein n=1 Tax=Massilia sp. TWR1-2-2 TaxID=2804584 RepID=UPI003CF9561C